MHSFRKIPVIVGQVAFFAAFFGYFMQFCYLRPYVSKSVDAIMASLLVAAMTVNFWVLYPLVYNKRSFLSYVLVSLLESLILNSIEYALSYRAILSLFDNSIQQLGGATMILLPMFFNTLFRDLSLLVLVGLIADNIALLDKEEDKELLRAKEQLIAKKQEAICVIDFATIYLCRQKKNYATLYSIDGQRYKKRISLRYLEDLLQGYGFVRISKGDLIRLSFIKKCKDNMLILRDEVVTNTKAITIGKKYVETVVPSILQFLQNNPDPDPATSDPKEKQGKACKPESDKLHPKIVKIQHYISSHRDCKLDEIIANTKIPKSTMTRYLKEMQQQGLIEYVGSKKTGGYRVREIEG